LFGQIEDEYDITIAKEAYDDYVKNGKKSRPISELWKELDL
jgi:acyl carrier protein